MFQEIHAFVIAFGALQEINLFLAGNSFLQQEVSTIDRKATTRANERLPMPTEIISLTVNFFLLQ